VACATVDATSSTHTGITPTLAGNDIVTQSIATTSTNVTAVTVYGNIQANAIFINFGEAILENTSNTSPPVWTTGAAPAIRCSLAIKGL